MHALTVNPTYGYMESGNSEFTFNAERKHEFLELARDIIENHHEYPNVGDLCRVIGINIRTFQRHVADDKRFGDDWHDLELKGEATCLSDMYALRKKNPMYMFGWLRARLPEKYDTSRRIESTSDLSWVKRVAESINTTIIPQEAEIVPPKPELPNPTDAS